MYIYDSLCNLCLCDATELRDGLIHVLKDKHLASVVMLDNKLYISMQLSPVVGSPVEGMLVWKPLYI